MISSNQNLCFLSGNMLKIIAALSMLIDHIGYIFFPEIAIFRIIGRLAFPIFAFMIAEGCRYTKNRLHYFLTVFGVGAACQIAYFCFERRLYFGILVTFSLSILVIYAMQNFKAALRSASPLHKRLALLLFLLTVTFVYVLSSNFTIDYGFWGIMLPAFASVFAQSDFHSHTLNISVFTVGLIILSISLGGLQHYSLCAIPILLLYSGCRGKRKMKYFFYIFYPLHLIILEGIYILLN